MVAAGKEEKALAIARNDLHVGVPSITVVVDEGWAKRSHKYSYNSLSGVAIIIGKETLFMGVRNKYCSSCAQAENKNTCVNEGLLCHDRYPYSGHAFSQ